MHQTMTLQALLGQHWPDQTALWAGLDARRTMLNQHIPSRVLQGRAPLQAYPEAAHSGRSYRPEWEAEMLDVQRVFHYLATCRWFRRVKSNGRFALGGYEYYLSRQVIRLSPLRRRAGANPSSWENSRTYSPYLRINWRYRSLTKPGTSSTMRVRWLVRQPEACITGKCRNSTHQRAGVLG
jgi:hypothetical protein